MTRIIGGAVGGRRISTPPGDRTRPTSDRVREALFSAVESWCGSLTGLRVLDLYAGSGALGLEAWSRGAAAVTLVEADRRTARLVSDNARSLGCTDVEVHARRVEQVLSAPPGAAYDLVLADPPYPLDEEALARVLSLLAAPSSDAGPAWLAPGALVVLERSSRSPEPRWPVGLSAARSKRYGETTLWYGHASPSDPSEDKD